MTEILDKKVVFVGNSGSYKTTVAIKLVSNDQLQGCSFFYPETLTVGTEIRPTVGVGVHPYKSDSGKKYNIWDCAGKPLLGGLRDGYYIQADIVFVFLGGENFQNSEQWIREVIRLSPNAQIHVIDGDCQEKYNMIKALLE